MTMRTSRDTFEAFIGGICSIRMIDEDGNAGEEAASLRFAKRTVGIKRYYEAKTAKFQVDKLIRVPYQDWLSTEYLAVINGQVYEIVQVQEIMDALPPSCDLSLHYTRQRRDAVGTV